MTESAALFLLVSCSGCICLYLTSPHQRWRLHPLPGRSGRTAGAVLIASALIVLCQTLQPIAAVFFAMTWVMLVFLLLPVISTQLPQRSLPRASRAEAAETLIAKSRRSYPPIQRDWLSKTLAGTLLGFALALGCSGLFSWSSGLPMGVKVQLAMWLVVPVWLCVLGGCYVLRSGARAWLWLGGITLFTAAALWLAYTG